MAWIRFLAQEFPYAAEAEKIFFFYFIYLFIYLPFLGPLPRHEEVSRLGV